MKNIKQNHIPDIYTLLIRDSPQTQGHGNFESKHMEKGTLDKHILARHKKKKLDKIDLKTILL